jgi:hypothetical protein
LARHADAVERVRKGQSEERVGVGERNPGEAKISCPGGGKC